MKVLIVINHAPDYREGFFRKLGALVDLTVIAQPCGSANLTPPDKRIGYEYIELPSANIFGFLWQKGIGNHLKKSKYDVLCIDFNPRMLSSLFFCLTHKKLRDKWVWRGTFFGRNKSAFIEKLRAFFLPKAKYCLAYSEEIAKHLQSLYGIEARSFNNTEIEVEDFKPIFSTEQKSLEHLNILFVGRNQPRKKLNRLVDLAERHKKARIRLVGPGMDTLNIPESLNSREKIQVFGKSMGKELEQHFNWSHVVFNPGGAGLLVMNAAKHGRGIVVDTHGYHGPEHYMARESGQLFIDFANERAVDEIVDKLCETPNLLRVLASEHQKLAKEKYTFDYMAEMHQEVFKNVLSKRRKSNY